MNRARTHVEQQTASRFDVASVQVGHEHVAFDSCEESGRPNSHVVGDFARRKAEGGGRRDRHGRRLNFDQTIQESGRISHVLADIRNERLLFLPLDERGIHLFLAASEQIEGDRKRRDSRIADGRLRRHGRHAGNPIDEHHHSSVRPRNEQILWIEVLLLQLEQEAENVRLQKGVEGSFGMAAHLIVHFKRALEQADGHRVDFDGARAESK